MKRASKEKRFQKVTAFIHALELNMGEDYQKCLNKRCSQMKTVL
jgi:hypothetical protein